MRLPVCIPTTTRGWISFFLYKLSIMSFTLSLAISCPSFNNKRLKSFFSSGVGVLMIVSSTCRCKCLEYTESFCSLVLLLQLIINVITMAGSKFFLIITYLLQKRSYINLAAKIYGANLHLLNREVEQR